MGMVKFQLLPYIIPWYPSPSAHLVHLCGRVGAGGGEAAVALCARHRRTQHQARPCQTRHEVNGRQKFCSVESRIQSAVSRGQSQGQLAVQEEDLKRRIPMETSRSGLGSSVIKTQGSGQVDQVGYGDQC